MDGGIMDSKTIPYVYIYTLTDPRDGVVRYVGKTNDPKSRIRQHVYERNKNVKCDWFHSVLKSGVRPILEPIEELVNVSDLEWREAERFWISYLKFLGCPLVNTDPGGKGTGSRSPNSCKLKGVKHTPERIAKSKEAWIHRRIEGKTGNGWSGRKQTKESIEKRLKTERLNRQLKISAGLPPRAPASLGARNNLRNALKKAWEKRRLLGTDKIKVPMSEALKEQRRIHFKNMHANESSEQIAARTAKAWETRRTRTAAQL